MRVAERKSFAFRARLRKPCPPQAEGSARSLPSSARGPARSSPARASVREVGSALHPRPATGAAPRLPAHGYAGAIHERPPGTRASAPGPAGRARVRAAQARAGRREPGPRRGALLWGGAEAPAPPPAGATRAPAAAAARAASRAGPAAGPRGAGPGRKSGVPPCRGSGVSRRCDARATGAAPGWDVRASRLPGSQSRGRSPSLPSPSQGTPFRRGESRSEEGGDGSVLAKSVWERSKGKGTFLFFCVLFFLHLEDQTSYLTRKLNTALRLHPPIL